MRPNLVSGNSHLFIASASSSSKNQTLPSSLSLSASFVEELPLPQKPNRSRISELNTFNCLVCFKDCRITHGKLVPFHLIIVFSFFSILVITQHFYFRFWSSEKFYNIRFAIGIIYGNLNCTFESFFFPLSFC